MKEIIKKIIFGIMRVEARLVLLRYRPKIIAITGSVGKTSTKDAVHAALSKTLHIRKSQKSLNSEIGVPLTILDLETGWNNPILWVKNIFLGFVQVIYHPSYPEWLVLEVGIDKPGDMKKNAKLVKPDIAVITSFPVVPVHVEYFDSPEGVATEKAKLIDYLKRDGSIILNGDDENVLRLKSRAQNKVYTYGVRNENVDILATNYSVIKSEESGIPTGITFKVNSEGNILPINIAGVLGDQFIYPALVALSVGKAAGVSLVDIAEGLKEYRAPAGRMNILEGKGGITIIDDTYNASPIAMQKAVETLASMEIATDAQKIAILADMTEIGRFTAKEHRHIGDLIKEYKIDVLITVGIRARLIAEQAMERGMAKKRIHAFNNSNDLVDFINKSDLFVPGSFVLIKGSQVTRMERVTKALLKDQSIAKEVLVRQDEEWLNR